MASKPVPPGITIADVAAQAGVSKASVSNHLNGRSHKLSTATRERIAEVIARLGYSPSLGAQRLSARSRSGSVALLVRRNLADAFAEGFFAEVFRGISQSFDTTATRGLVMSRPAGSTADEEARYLSSLARGIVDGFLVFDVEEHDAVLKLFGLRQIPFVAFGQLDPAVGPAIGADHAAGVAQATAWLLAKGHRRFAMAAGSSRLLLRRHRERGLFDTLAAAGLGRTAAELHGPEHQPDRLAWLTRLLATPEGASAFLLPASWYDDWCRALAARPPEARAVELVLLDHFNPASPVTAQIARIETPTAEIGARGAAMLEDYISTGQRPETCLLPAHFLPPA